MHFGGKRPTAAGATAMAAAVIGGLLGGAPAAAAAPVDHGSPGASTPERDSSDGVPPVWPRPQSLRAHGPELALGDEATLIADGDADPYALDALRGLLHDAGVRTVNEATPGGKAPTRGLVVQVGGRGAAGALRALRAPERGDLPSGGYLLATGPVEGRPTIALSGVGPDGLFHAVQTLRQLLVKREGKGSAVAGVTVRDWPGTAVRGTTEGFYGSPWSHRDRLAQLDFMGRTKQNRYLYAPGDDPFRQARWRDPYPAERREEFRDLATRARANHVTLGWAVSPGQEMCFSSSKDLKALLRKVDAMWALGVRSFQLQFQDVSYSEWHCDADADTFGSGPEAAAAAQAKVANALARHLAGRYPGSAPLSLMPTEYFQDGDTEFRRALSGALDDGVDVAWTGVGVVPRTITGGELAGARSAFGHRLVTMDNYPVNDWAQDRIFLGPYTGRDPAVATQSAALLANAMEQPTASRIPLFTAADFAWNPRGYRPRSPGRRPSTTSRAPTPRPAPPCAPSPGTTPPRRSAATSPRICARSSTRSGRPWPVRTWGGWSGPGTGCATPSGPCATPPSGCPARWATMCGPGSTSSAGTATRASGPWTCSPPRHVATERRPGKPGSRWRRCARRSGTAGSRSVRASSIPSSPRP
ncbi:hypothetical protein SSPO_064950 [Streptomyces antimycoticus]|uniref:GH84 domain-containing protein n=1 Tax=Streptomyces antimycoticus TaxID=68175 RepID=A0A499VC97_9ACTN|nr:hypothetical protein SSPO_064950 [Streptomyces antimycoticus]